MTLSATAGIKLYPTSEQAAFLNQVFGSVRAIWNDSVASFNDPHICPVTVKEFRALNPWALDMVSSILRQKQMDFERTRNQFFNKDRKKQLGRMKFKKRGGHESFRVSNSDFKPQHIDVENGRIRLPKVGWIKVRGLRQPEGRIMSITVKRNPAGKITCSILTEHEKHEPLPKTGKAVGIDLGLKDLFTLSDGTVQENPRWYRESQAKLARAQRVLSRRKKGSNRRRKQRIKVARLHEKIANQRKNLLQKLTTQIVREYDVIGIEDLNVAGMKGMLGKSVSDACFAEFRRMLEYKADWYGKEVIAIDRFFPSTRMCSGCGQIHDMPLDKRIMDCDCGTRLDRDYNASLNIKVEALRNIVTARGGAGDVMPPDEPRISKITPETLS